MMRKRCDFVEWGVCMLLMMTCFSACSSIDDDLSNCNEEGQFQTDYQLKLVTNMTTELKTQLTTMTELSVAGSLETHLKNIFTDPRWRPLLL